MEIQINLKNFYNPHNYMISHKYKFIYISPPRCGNTSLLLRMSNNDMLSNKIRLLQLLLKCFR